MELSVRLVPLLSLLALVPVAAYLVLDDPIVALSLVSVVVITLAVRAMVGADDPVVRRFRRT